MVTGAGASSSGIIKIQKLCDIKSSPRFAIALIIWRLDDLSVVGNKVSALILSRITLRSGSERSGGDREAKSSRVN